MITFGGSLKAEALLRKVAEQDQQSFDIVFDLRGPHGIHAERVMAYIRDFCFANKTTANGDIYQMAVMEGRRQVFLKIMEIRKFKYHEIDAAKGTLDELIGDDDFG